MAFQKGFIGPALLLLFSVIAFLNSFALGNAPVDGLNDAKRDPSELMENVMNEIYELKKDQKELKNKVEQLENKNQEYGNEIEFLKAKNDMQEEMYSKSREEIRQLTLKLEKLISKKESPIENRAINNALQLIPSNCEDLRKIGHSLNGFYPVKNPLVNGNNNNMRLVFCNFGVSPEKESGERQIGSIDIKSFPEGVYFYVKKIYNFEKAGAIIPFEVEVLNIGSAMELNTGTFTAPVNGVYHFSFKAIGHGWLLSTASPYTAVRLLWNGKHVSQACASTLNKGDEKASFTLTLLSVLKLQKGDVIQLVLTFGAIFDDITSNTQFIGYLMREF